MEGKFGDALQTMRDRLGNPKVMIPVTRINSEINHDLQNAVCLIKTINAAEQVYLFDILNESIRNLMKNYKKKKYPVINDNDARRNMSYINVQRMLTEEFLQSPYIYIVKSGTNEDSPEIQEQVDKSVNLLINEANKNMSKLKLKVENLTVDRYKHLKI